MATKLDKDITRESSIKIDDKEIMVTITAKQTVSLKLKGMRTGTVEIPIEQLHNQLTGKVEDKEEPKKTSKSVSTIQTNKVTKDNPMINLFDLRSQNAISTLDLPTLCKFDQIIKNLIEVMSYGKES